MTRWTLGWKVTDKALGSFCGGDYGVQYSFSRNAVPHKKCGPLCVFDTKRNAEEFTRGCRGVFINPCAYKESDKTVAFFPNLDFDSGIFASDTSQLPPGTVLADEVILLREV